MLVQNLYNLAGGQHIREQPTRVVGDAEAREDGAADMLGVVCAKRSLTVDRDLPAVYAGEGTVYAYGAYGEPANDNWSGSRFRYTGQIMLREAKLYHYKARVYDPQLGRFLQTDPVGYTDDVNLYAYVKNDPLNHADPRKGRLAVRRRRAAVTRTRAVQVRSITARATGSAPKRLAGE